METPPVRRRGQNRRGKMPRVAEGVTASFRHAAPTTGQRIEFLAPPGLERRTARRGWIPGRTAQEPEESRLLYFMRGAIVEGVTRE